LDRASIISSPTAPSNCSIAPRKVASTLSFSAGARSTAKQTSTWWGSGIIRWPGCFGSAFLYYAVPRVILFREEHSRRVFVDKVDFVSAPGSSEGIVRNGGPYALLTGLALFDFDKSRRRFRLRSVHRGASSADVQANTGFEYDAPTSPPTTVEPDSETLALLRGRVRQELAETYPQFAATLVA
jgi:glutaconate CoA-transferase subunit B